MGKLFENEVELRKYAKEVSSLILEKHDIDKAVQIMSEHEEILSYDFGRRKYLSLLSTIRYKKALSNKYEYLRKLIDVGFHIYEDKKNYEELVFFAAAKSDVENLRMCMEKIPKENYHENKQADTILLFFIKYGDLENPNYLETLKVLMNEYKLDVNKADYKNQSAVIILLNKYSSLQTKGIVQYNDIILNAISIILTRNNVDLLSHKIHNKTAQDIIDSFQLKDLLEELRIKNKFFSCSLSVIFTLLSRKKEHEFLQQISEMTFHEEHPYDIQDDNNTLLQLACEKNLKKVTTYLLKKGANLTKVTKRNTKTPLEIVARRNHYSIFKDILKENKLIIDSELFTIFLVNRGGQIKTKYFDEILCYDKLQVDLVDGNGNTPLHYAIIFANTEAVLKLLKRGAFLSIKNKYGKDPLNYITKEDLELYMDDCIILDNHNKLLNKNYELEFDFSSFVTKDENKEVVSEVDIPSRICSSDILKPLAKHLLMITFIEIKWSFISSFCNKILLLLFYSFFPFVYPLIFSDYLRHLKCLCILLISVLIYCTFQSTVKFVDIQREDIISFVLLIVFNFSVYCLFKNRNTCMLILTLTLYYQSLQQQLCFSKCQARIVNGFRKITPYLLALFALHYFIKLEYDRHSQLNLIIPFIIGYIIVLTHSFNVLVDRARDIQIGLEYSFKMIYSKNAFIYTILYIEFIKFYENIFYYFKTLLDEPFIYKIVEGKKRCRLNFYLSRNKFVNERLNFLKLDDLTVKQLHDFVIKRNQKPAC